MNPFSKDMEQFYDMYTNECMNSIIDPSKKVHYHGQIVLPYAIWKTQMVNRTHMLQPYYNTTIILKSHNK